VSPPCAQCLLILVGAVIGVCTFPFLARDEYGTVESRGPAVGVYLLFEEIGGAVAADECSHFTISFRRCVGEGVGPGIGVPNY